MLANIALRRQFVNKNQGYEFDFQLIINLSLKNTVDKYLLK